MRLRTIASSLAVASLCSSCIGDMPEQTKKMINENYNRHFVYQYGAVDPTHTWSYATKAYAIVNVAEGVETDNRHVNVYTVRDNPDDVRLLARYPLGQDAFAFDCPADLTQVLVEVTDTDGNVTHMATADIGDGRLILEVGATPRQQSPQRAASRATQTPDGPEGIGWIVAAEDLMYYSTHDFNDVVLGISHVCGDTIMTIYPLACGTSYEASIYYDDTELGEMHDLMGVDAGTPHNHQTYQGPGTGITVAVPTTYSLVDDNRLKIYVTDKPDPIQSPTAGTVPLMLVLPHRWQWPVEDTKMGEAYPDFNLWCKDATALGWIDTPVPERVVRRTSFAK